MRITLGITLGRVIRRDHLRNSGDVTYLRSYVLDEDGTPILDEDGTSILDEGAP